MRGKHTGYRRIGAVERVNRNNTSMNWDSLTTTFWYLAKIAVFTTGGGFVDMVITVLKTIIWIENYDRNGCYLG